MQNNNSKLNTVLLIVLIILVVFGIILITVKNDRPKDDDFVPITSNEEVIGTHEVPTGPFLTEDQYVPPAPQPTQAASATYTYKSHGFTIQLPRGYIPREQASEGGPSIDIGLPNNSHLNYVTDASFWVQNVLPQYTFTGTQKIGSTTFNVYNYGNHVFYWYKQGNVAYEFSGDINLLKTFEVGGWD